MQLTSRQKYREKVDIFSHLHSEGRKNLKKLYSLEQVANCECTLNGREGTKRHVCIGAIQTAVTKLVKRL